MPTEEDFDLLSKFKIVNGFCTIPIKAYNKRAKYPDITDVNNASSVVDKKDLIVVLNRDALDINSDDPKEWHIFRNWKKLDSNSEYLTWHPAPYKWRNFCALAPKERAKILWLWSQYVKLATVGDEASRGPKVQSLNRMRKLLILTEMEKRDTQYRYFWAANFLNIIYSMPLEGGFDPDVHETPNNDHHYYDLESRTKTKTGSLLEERVGEVQLKKSWSEIYKQIKLLEKIPP
ncbi:hypothetical protein ACFL3H_07835, partial [Gemmatimonadota bacterium]